jgi:hypothetical protein
MPPSSVFSVLADIVKIYETRGGGGSSSGAGIASVDAIAAGGSQSPEPDSYDCRIMYLLVDPQSAARDACAAGSDERTCTMQQWLLERRYDSSPKKRGDAAPPKVQAARSTSGQPGRGGSSSEL